MGVSVQVSFYALDGAELAAALQTFITVLDGYGLDYEVGAMSTVIRGELDGIFAALRDAYGQASEGTAAVMVMTVSNACPVT